MRKSLRFSWVAKVTVWVQLVNLKHRRNFTPCSQEWSRLLPQHLSAPAAGPTFYARVYHPAFNVDKEDAEETIIGFHNHARAVGKGVQGLRSIFARVREARVGQQVPLITSYHHHNKLIILMNRDVKSRTAPVLFPSFFDNLQADRICASTRNNK